MTPKPIRVIRGVGSELTLRQLEAASAKLLVARIRNEEPQVSYTFIQRLLDEVIRRRREDLQEEADLDALIADIADEDDEEFYDDSDLEEIVDLVNADLSADETLEIPDERIEEESFDFDEFEFTDLDVACDPVTEDVWDGGEEERAVEFIAPPRPKSVRARTIVSKQHSRWASTMNYWRILVIIFLAVCVMVCGVAVMGCNHYDERYAVYPEPGDDVVGPIVIKYRNLDKEQIDPPEERRAHIRRAVELTLDWFRADWGFVPFITECQVFMGGTPEEFPTYVPSGAVNGGGFFTFADRVVQVSSGKCDTAKYLYHELNHARLLDAGVPPLVNSQHKGDSWLLIAQRTEEIEATLCKEFSLGSDIPNTDERK